MTTKNRVKIMEKINNQFLSTSMSLKNVNDMISGKKVTTVNDSGLQVIRDLLIDKIAELDELKIELEKIEIEELKYALEQSEIHF